MRVKRVISLMLTAILLLSAFSACNTEAEATGESTGDTEDIKIQTVETEETTVEEEGRKGSELGSFMAINKVCSTENFSVEHTDKIYIKDAMLDNEAYCMKNDKYILIPWYGKPSFDQATGNHSREAGLTVYNRETQSMKSYSLWVTESIVQVIPFELGGKAYALIKGNFDMTYEMYGLNITDDDLEAVKTDELDPYIMIPEESRLFYDCYEYQRGEVFIWYTYDPMFTLHLEFVTDDLQLIASVQIDSDENITNYAEPQFYCCGDDKVVVRWGDITNVIDINEYILTEKKVRAYTSDPALISNSASGNYYVNTLEGLFIIDPRKDSIKEILNYNKVLGDPTILSLGRFLYEEDGSYYFLSEMFDATYEESLGDADRTVFETIFKVSPEANIYADRKVLTLASSVADTDLVRNIHKFNESNDTYYITFTIQDGSVPGSYAANNMDLTARMKYSDYDDSYSQYMYLKSRRESVLKDYVKQSSTDLLYGFGTEAGLAVPDYCMDMSGLLAECDEYKSNKIYTNIVDAAKTSDGKLYKIPLVFSLMGMLDLADEDPYITYGKGMDYDTYEEACSFPTLCNSGCMDSFFLMLNNDYSKYVDFAAGESHFGSDEFRSLCSHYWIMKSTVDNMRDSYVDDDAYALQDPVDAEVAALYLPSTYETALDTVNAQYDFDNIDLSDYPLAGFIGLPSLDSHGPAFNTLSSISIGARTSDIEGSFEFVRFLMSGDQVMPCVSLAFSLNREMNRKVQENVVSYLDELENPSEVVDYCEAHIENTNNEFLKDSVIDDIILKSVMEYFYGDMKLADMASQLDSAVTKVLEG